MVPIKIYSVIYFEVPALDSHNEPLTTNMCHAQDRSTAIQWPPVVCHACISRTALNSHSLPRIAVTGGGEGTLEEMTLTADTLQIVHTNGRADAIPNGHVGKKLEAVHVIDLSLQHSGPYLTAYTALWSILHCIHSTPVQTSLHTQHSGPYLTAYTQHSGPNFTAYTQHSGPYFTVHMYNALTVLNVYCTTHRCSV